MGLADSSPEGRTLSERIRHDFRQLGLPTEPPYPREDILRWFAADKKRRGDTVTLVLPLHLGQCKLVPMRLDDLQGNVS